MRPTFNGGLVNGDFISKVLLLPDKADCYKCLTGFGFSPDETCSFVIKDRVDPDIWQTNIKKFRQ
jgi:hypothetical protein